MLGTTPVGDAQWHWHRDPSPASHILLPFLPALALEQDLAARIGQTAVQWDPEPTVGRCPVSTQEFSHK